MSNIRAVVLLLVDHYSMSADLSPSGDISVLTNIEVNQDWWAFYRTDFFVISLWILKGFFVISL